MHHIIKAMYCIALCTFLMTYSMEDVTELELPINSTTQKKMNIIDIIDRQIDAKYPSQNLFADLWNCSQLEKKDMESIVTIANTQCTKHEVANVPQLLNLLYNQNSFFEKAVNYFTQLAHTNAANVTYNNIDTIYNPESDQPVEQLNQLPLLIKKYIMSRVYDNQATYTMDIPHLTTIILCQICPKAHLLATYSKEKILYLWDLQTGERLAAFSQEKDPSLTILQFNEDGSKLCTVGCGTSTKDHDEKSLITIWHPQQHRVAHQMIHDNHVYHIDFINDILTVYSQNRQDFQKYLSLWQLDRIKPTKIGISQPLPWREESLCGIKDPHSKYSVDTINNKVSVTTKVCPALLLCTKAVENSFHSDAITPNVLTQKIKEAHAYNNCLTDYEKEMVNQHINFNIQRSNDNNLILLLMPMQ